MNADEPWPWDDCPPGGVHPPYPILKRDTTATVINPARANDMNPDTQPNRTHPSTTPDPWDDFPPGGVHASPEFRKAMEQPMPTPLTDAAAWTGMGAWDEDNAPLRECVSADFARTLERELQAKDAEIARLTAIGPVSGASEADVYQWLREAQSRVTELERQLAAAGEDKARLQQELIRAVAWASNTALALGALKSKVCAFAAGVTNTQWKTNEPRVIGFGLEYTAMVDEAHKPSPGFLATDRQPDGKEGV